MCPILSVIHATTMLVVMLPNVHSANILFVSIMPSISHQKAFQPVWKELSLRGHNVHAITTDPLNDPALRNLTEYDFSSLYDLLNSVPQDTIYLMMKKPNFLLVFLKDIFITGKLSLLGETAFQHKEMQRLLKNNIKFDVVIAEWLFPTMSAFGAKYQCPLIGITSLGAPLVALDTVGNPSHPIITPDHNLPVTRDMLFRERLMSALYSVYVRTWYHLVVLPREDKVVKKYLGEDLPYIGDIERNVSILLLNRNPVFHRVLPLVPAVIELGGISLNRTKPKLDVICRQIAQYIISLLIFNMWLILRIAVVILVTFVLTPNVYSANILLVVVSPSLSHQKAFQPLWKELSLKGHNVHVVTPNPLKDPDLTNLTEYDISFLYDRLSKLSQDTRNYVLKKPTFSMVFLKDIFMTKIFSNMGELIFQHEEMQRLLKSDVKFDVVIAEWLFPTMSAFGAKYQCPLIGISSLGAPLVALDTVGNPSHPITAPDHNLPVTRDMSFRERIMSVLYSVYVRTWYHLVVLPREDRVVKKYLGEDLPYIGDIERNVSILLLNRNHVFHRVMPVVPSIIELGGISLNRTKPKLDLELQKFLDKSKQGAIYFSLGSNLKTIYLPDNIRKIFLDVFGKLPYNVLLKWENDTLPGKPDNVFISKWLPQLTVLDHPNVKLFLMQGGLQSSEEAILSEIPIIGFPTHSDQTVNVDTFVKYGAGIGLDLDYLNPEELNSSIYEIMTNPSYKENAKSLASLMYDQPFDGLKRAVWWIEYVIRHKGARHLRSPILDVPWWQYFMLDIIAFLLVTLSAILLTIYLVLKGLYSLLRKIARTIFPSGKENIKKKQ